MDLVKEYRSFINSYYLSEGIRVTTGAIVPALVLKYFDLLSVGVLVSLGAVMVSGADSPGPVHHRRNGMQACTIIVFVVCLITGYTASYPILLGCWIAVACFVLSMIAVYGGRVISIGSAALLAMVLNMNRGAEGWQVFLNALYVAAGGLWYMLLSLVLYRVRPYRLMQQALGDCILSTAAYMRVRARFYEQKADINKIYDDLMEKQVEVQHSQELVRELLFKSRAIVKDSTVTSRTLMMIFIDTVDLFEKAVTAFFPYESLHQFFDKSNILEHFRDCIASLAEALDDIGLAVKSGRASVAPETLQGKLAALQEYFTRFRDENLNADNLDSIITLRKILQAIENMTDRVQALHNATRYDRRRAVAFKPSGDHDRFVTHTDLSWKLLGDNLSIESDIFRHALRVSIAALTGYIVSHLFMLGHSYWILLTIIVILKPAYSLTKKRNYQRVLGTISGALLGIVLLYFIKDKTVLFFCMLVLMVTTYTFIRTNYLLAVVCMTPYVLLLLYLLDSGQFRTIVTDRIVDTAIGSAIAVAANFFLLPAWEQDQFRKYQSAAIATNLDYFRNASQAFVGEPVPDTAYRLSRKHAFVALANLSDAFSRLLAEPKRRQKNARRLHQFTVMSHTLTSHIATLGDFGKSLAAKYRSADFEPVVADIATNLAAVQSALDEPEPLAAAETLAASSPLHARIEELLTRRSQELEESIQSTDTGRRLSELKPIVDRFRYIEGITRDLLRTMDGKTV